MSIEIERFGRFGQYVLFSEYERVVASVAARSMEQIDSIRAVHEAEVARLRDEMEWLRHWLPPMQALVNAVEEEFCSQETEVSEPDESKVSYPEETCPITFGMIREARKAIDYAMGDGK